VYPKEGIGDSRNGEIDQLDLTRREAIEAKRGRFTMGKDEEKREVGR
jgi:hypothetical protein